MKSILACVKNSGQLIKFAAVMSEATGTDSRVERFRTLITAVVDSNEFYRDKLAEAGFTARHAPQLEDLHSLPFTTKTELAESQEAHPPFGRNLTYPLEHYTRVHRTSGTSGRPLHWLDTEESWQWWLDCWREVYLASGVRRSDRVLVAFSFGPFIGFWTAFESGRQLGALMLAGGGLSSEQRLASIFDLEATVLICTPTYALRLAEVATQSGLDLASSSVRLTIHAGEPGASIPSVKQRIEAAWGARAFDHAGATEVGAWGIGCGVDDHLHVNESEFIIEVVDPHSGSPVQTDSSGVQSGELVLTNLGRVGSPVIRYRTGDAVRLTRERCACGQRWAYLEGGVVGRLDDMFIVRGVNIYPSALENIIREIEAIEEFQIEVGKSAEMAELLIKIEVSSGEADTVAKDLRDRIRRGFALRPEIALCPLGSLPRFELKARRFKRHGHPTGNDERPGEPTP